MWNLVCSSLLFYFHPSFLISRPQFGKNWEWAPPVWGILWIPSKFLHVLIIVEVSVLHSTIFLNIRPTVSEIEQVWEITMYISQPRAWNFYRNWMYFVTLVNDERQSVRMVHGHDLWMIYILMSVLVAFLDKKKGFLGKKSFSSWNFDFFFGRKLTKYLITKNGERNPDPDVECRSQGVFLQFGYLLFFHFNKNW